jgi:superfamily I DNA/RNA helicase
MTSAPLRAEALLARLTGEQAAFAEDQSPAVCCIAAAGSGKTAALAARVVHLVRFRGIAPERVRVFVFTRAARDEIARRVASVLGGEVADRVDVTTFHSFAARVVLRDVPAAELATDALAETYLRSLYEGPLRRKGLPGITAVRDGIVAYEADRFEDDDVRRAVGILLGRMEETDAIPLWDLLPRCDALLEEPDFADAWQVDHVLVDEAQDVTRREERIARRTGRFFAAVSDPRQAIMGFRGAVGFCALKPFDTGPEADHHHLTRSFRFGAEIAAYANAISERLGCGPCSGDPDRVDAVGYSYTNDNAMEALKGRESGLAILCRTHDECDLAERQLSNLGLRVYYAGRAEDRGEGVDPFSAAGDRAVIATIHAAKGREWDTVYLPSSPIFPRDMDDLSVLYVAVTRARSLLLLGSMPDWRQLESMF